MNTTNTRRTGRPQTQAPHNVMVDAMPSSDAAFGTIEEILRVVPVSRWVFARISPEGALQDVSASDASCEDLQDLRQEFKRQRVQSKTGPRIAAALRFTNEFESGITLLFADATTTFGILTLMRNATFGSFTSSEVCMLTLALLATSDRLSALRIDPDDGRKKGDDSSRRPRSTETSGDSAYYVLDQEFEIVLAWNPHEQRRVALNGLRTTIAERLPVVLEQTVRELTAAWGIEPLTRAAGMARPVPFLVVHTQPMMGPTGLFVGVRIDRSRAPNSLSAAALKYSITQRELQVLALMLDGAHLTEITDRLNITSSTVQDHIHSMVVKTESQNRTELVARVLGWRSTTRDDERLG